MTFTEKIKADRANVASEIKRIISEIGSDYEVREICNNSSIIIEKEDGTYIYIRLELGAGGNILCNFSSVNIGKTRAGIFSRIMQGVIGSNIIKNAVITSVLTEDMHNFCKKHNFIKKDSGMIDVTDYIVKGE